MLDESRLCLALSLLAGAPPIARRVDAARSAGYRVVESWWPWDRADPGADAVGELVSHIAAAGATMHLLNLTEGSPRWGGRGVAGIPEAADEYDANARAALGFARSAGVRLLHVLAGNVGASGREAGTRVLTERMTALARAVAPDGIGLVVEILNDADHPDYLLGSVESALGVVAEVRDRSGGDVGILADTYHLAKLGIDPADFVREHAALVRHVQLADHPGRGEPGTGGIRFAEVIDALDECGYDGMLGLEYLPGSAPVRGPTELWGRLVSPG